MNYITVVIATVGVYVLLGLLLLSLGIFSLWRWWVKAGAIVLTLVAFIGSYFAIAGLLGWPAPAKVPDRFSLMASKVVEPDKVSGAPGKIYMWVEQVDTNNIEFGDPRAYVVAYTDKLADALRAAQERLSNGEKVLGEMLEGDAQEAAAGEEGTEGDNELSGSNGGEVEGKKVGGGDSDGQFSAGEGTLTGLDISDALRLSVMPPVVMPDKG